MKGRLLAVGLICVLALVCFALAVPAVAGEEEKVVTVVGKVSVVKDDAGAITAVKLTKKVEDKEEVYNVTLDDKGKELGDKLAGKTAEVKGTVVKKDDASWLTVKEYKAVDEAK